MSCLNFRQIAFTGYALKTSENDKYPSMKTFITLPLLTLSLSAIAQTAPYSFEKLSETRKTVTLSELSLEEKNLVIDQARIILKDLFVHRDLKLQHFGPDADPLPFLLDLKNRAQNLSTISFHREMLKAFQKMHDWHTTYQMPKPYQCYRTLLPIAFKAVRDEFGNEVIGVDSVVPNPEVKKLLPEGLDLKAGDILVKYNDVDPQQIIARNMIRVHGANPAAVKRDSVGLLGWVSQKYNLFPEQDTVTVTLKAKDGTEKNYTLPWITRGDNKCLNPEQNSGVTEGEKAEKDSQNEFNQMFRKPRKLSRFKGPGDLIESKDPILKYKVLRNEFGSFGYLRLESFVPEKLSSQELVIEIKRLLNGPLAEGDGLIIDIRSNGGGYIWIGEAMVQLLNQRNTVPLNFLLKNSETNKFFWETSGPTDPFTVELRKADSEGRAYSTPIPLNPAAGLNSMGQFFMKPVAVFINAGCYSTCDMFSASMQDLGAGIIVGEDSNTGAGGANNWNHQTIMNSLPEGKKGPFKPLPGGLNIGFSFRQTIRTGLHTGEFIEDTGVKADMMVEATTDDLDTSEAQLRKISRRLAEEALKFRSSVKIEGMSSIDVKLNERPSVKMKWENTDAIDVRVNGIVKGTIDLENSQTEGRDVVIPDFVSTATPANSFVELLGKSEGSRVWRKVLNIRTVPESIVIGKQKPLIMDFESTISPLVVYNINSPAENGWLPKNGELKVGGGDEYDPNVNTKASLFATIKDNVELSFQATVNSEKDFDKFSVSIFMDGFELETLIEGISGDIPTKSYNFDLTRYKDQNVEIRFAFESDSSVQGAGVKIDNLSIK